MVLCVGLIPQGDRGRGSFQEFDNHARFGSIVEKVLVLDDAVHTTRTRTHNDLRRRLVPTNGLAPCPDAGSNNNIVRRAERAAVTITGGVAVPRGCGPTGGRTLMMGHGARVRDVGSSAARGWRACVVRP